MNSEEEILQLITDCENRESKLRLWERNFIQSISEQISEKPLTEKQISILEKIWDRIT